MKYYIIAGEASGDLHGSNLMKHLLKEDENAEFRFWGGDLMLEHSNNIVKHYRDLAFMGFAEVAMNLRTILGNITLCKSDLLEYKPDVLILIDYPGFNMRIAEFAKKNGMKVFYYIAPQIWAWKEGRIKNIKKYVDKVFVIQPFEKAFYKKHNYEVDYVGHPLVDAIENSDAVDEDAFRKKFNLNSKPIIAVLPGSRKQEISKSLPLMLSVMDNFKDYQFVIAGAPSQKYSFYQKYITSNNVSFIDNKTYNLLQISHAALVTSGTATLEAALLKVPEIVCYKTSSISYHIGKRIVKIDYISLPNLIMDKAIVTELIQDDFNTERLTSELSLIIEGDGRKEMLNNFDKLTSILGGGGASAKVANLIVKYLQ
ncbi:MAG: lipid-A-disaccharide synthase [Ichthyobacteriaceae bacterium]|nr:lipid-A-disaccharide synthase [Ichthyobacteriaceae bacterium]